MASGLFRGELRASVARFVADYRRLSSSRNIQKMKTGVQKVTAEVCFSHSFKRAASMTIFRLIGAATISICVIGSPAMARDASPGASPPAASPPAESIYCATREPGNPHSKYCDYTAWSKSREIAAWNGSLDDACIKNPAFVPSECGLDPASKRSFFGWFSY